jgi:hypothetical protein
MDHLIYVFIFSFIIVILFLLYRIQKLKKLANTTFIENCLVTKSPILIWSEKQSLFRIQNSFHAFFLIFQQHGYETFRVQTRNQKKSSFIQKLDKYEKENLKFHFFLSKNGVQRLKKIVQNRNYSCVRSINEIDFTSPLLTLQKAVRLAEEDFW